MEITPIKGPAPELYNLPMASSRFGLPDGYQKAHDTFAAAQQDYQAGKPEKAAPKFIEIAQLVKAPSPKTTYSDAFAKMRIAAYKDAAIAFGQAGEVEAGRKALSAAIKADPENAPAIKALLATLS